MLRSVPIRSPNTTRQTSYNHKNRFSYRQSGNQFIEHHRSRQTLQITRESSSKIEKPDTKPKGNTISDLPRFFRKWGAIAVGTHLGISACSFLFWYTIVSAGIDPSPLFNHLYEKTGWNAFQMDGAHAGSLAVMAYAVHKVSMPMRLPLTFILTPMVGKMLGKKENDEDDDEKKQ